MAIGDWLESYRQELKKLFGVERLPSYSTLRRTLLELDYEDYSARLASFFEITPIEVENKVHYVRDVIQAEDKSRIRTTPLPQVLAIAHNLAINLYRDAGFSNMAQAYAERYARSVSTIDTASSFRTTKMRI